MIQDIKDGGLQLPDLETRVKVIHVNWVKYLWNNPKSTTLCLVQENIGIEHISSIIVCKSNHTPLFEDQQFLPTNLCNLGENTYYLTYYRA